MMWIRRCKQEELTLIDSFNDEDEATERMKLISQFSKNNDIPSVVGSKAS